MQRRTFLKAVFAAAVAPASVVKALYRPEAGLSDKDIADVLTATLNDLPRGFMQKAMQESFEAMEKCHEALFRCYKPNLVYEGPVNFICKNRRANMEIIPKEK